MQDKSYQEAMRDLHDRLTGEIQEQVKSRLSDLTGNTASSLVVDIEDTQMRAVVLDILCMIKVVAYLDTLTGMDVLKKAEQQELAHYIQQLHERVYPQRK
jgi:hypothetical protein